MAPTGEQCAFIDDPSRLVLIKGPPRSGKTTGLWLRAVSRGRPVLWAGLWREAGGLPKGSRSATLGRLISELYLRRHGGLTCDGLRQVNLVELKRIFHEINGDFLAGHIDLWFQAYLAVKRSRQDSQIYGVNAILTRLDLKVETDNTREILLEAIERTDRALTVAGMIWPHDLMSVFEQAIRTKPGLIADALGQVEAICVEDVQLLSAVEWRLLLAFSRTGLSVWASLGQFQCINLRDGGAALAYEKRLLNSGFSCSSLTIAVGLSEAQSQTIRSSLGMERTRPFRGVGSAPFNVEYLEHESMDDVVARLAARVQKQIADGKEPGRIAVLTPLPEMTGFLTRKLMAVGIPAVERGRSSGENSPGFTVCMAIVKSICDPRDTVALRQVAYLWIEDSASFEKCLRASVSTSQNLQAVAKDYRLGDEVDAMLAWIAVIQDGGPGQITDSVRQAPLWPADPGNEAGLARFDECISMLHLQDDWQSPAWTTLAAMAAEPLDDRALDMANIPVLTIADSQGCQWDEVNVIGFSQGLMPGPCLKGEASLEAHALAQALSRSTRLVQLHHVRQLRLNERTPEIKLKPSAFSERLGVSAQVPEQDMDNPKFKPREAFKY